LSFFLKKSDYLLRFVFVCGGCCLFLRLPAAFRQLARIARAGQLSAIANTTTFSCGNLDHEDLLRGMTVSSNDGKTWIVACNGAIGLEQFDHARVTFAVANDNGVRTIVRLRVDVGAILEQHRRGENVAVSRKREKKKNEQI
jgi:hypothetical protein